MRRVLRDPHEQLGTKRRTREFEVVPDVRDHARREALGGEWQQFGHGGSSLRITPDTSRFVGVGAPFETKLGEQTPRRIAAITVILVGLDPTP
jgi:hypothetical protein